MRARPLITALCLNAVPAAGWYFAEWSAGTTLVLYWLETLLGALLVAGRILLHRRTRPSRGHWDYKAPEAHQPHSTGGSTYLTAFFVPALIFTGGHAIFLFALGAIVMSKHLTPEATLDTAICSPESSGFSSSRGSISSVT